MTTVRTATEAEERKYGVKLRIIGSKGHTQNRVAVMRVAAEYRNVGSSGIDRPSYLDWLCKQRGWYTYEGRVCQLCHGTGERTESYYGSRRHGRVHSCGSCQSGRVGVGKKLPDSARAEAYVGEQARRLQKLCEEAVTYTKDRLRERGYMPVVYGGTMPVATLADYLARERVRVERQALYDAALAEHYRQHAVDEACCAELMSWGDMTIINGRHLFYYSWYGNDPAVREAQQALSECGQVHHSLWAIPGESERVHVGTEAARKDWNAARSIVFKPALGRTWPPPEIDEYLGDVLAEQLPLAA